MDDLLGAVAAAIAGSLPAYGSSDYEAAWRGETLLIFHDGPAPTLSRPLQQSCGTWGTPLTSDFKMLSPGASEADMRAMLRGGEAETQWLAAGYRDALKTAAERILGPGEFAGACKGYLYHPSMGSASSALAHKARAACVIKASSPLADACTFTLEDSALNPAADVFSFSRLPPFHPSELGDKLSAYADVTLWVPFFPAHMIDEVWIADDGVREDVVADLAASGAGHVVVRNAPQ